MEKQIKEIARDICGNFIPNGNCDTNDNSCYLECVYGVCAARLYNAGYRKQEWYNVTKHLPTESGQYIVCRSDGHVFPVKFYANPDGTGGRWGTKSNGKTIERWTYMPKPTEGE